MCFTGHIDLALRTDRHTKSEISVPYDSGQVYLVFGWIWSIRKEGIPYSPTSARKTLGTRLTYTENHIKINICNQNLSRHYFGT